MLWQQGNTIVLCTASISADLPPWMKDDKPGGWITCEYVMLPASTPQRKQWPKIGHTDSRGTEQYNQGLSERRANSVKKWLIDHGAVAGDHIDAKGYGESNPVGDNKTEKGRFENRRAEILIYCQ